MCAIAFLMGSNSFSLTEIDICAFEGEIGIEPPAAEYLPAVILRMKNGSGGSTEVLEIAQF